MNNWDDLRYFLAVARERTLDAAAKRLKVDPTTVGRRLQRLGNNQDSVFFEAGPSGFRLTDSGERLFAFAEEVERNILSASEAISGERAKLRGTVRLSLSEGLASWLVAPHLHRFAARHPDIAIELVTTNGFLNPSKREADLAVMLARPQRGPLTSHKLADYSLGLYTTGHYLERSPAIESPADLRHHSLIGYVADFIYADELRYLDELRADLKLAYSSSSINIQHRMIRAGLGIGVLPHFIGKQQPELQPLFEDELRIRRSFWVVVHSDLRQVSRIRAVSDWLGELVTAQRSLLL
jgi:DNA-binding transcriptional LysR family regulator